MEKAIELFGRGVNESSVAEATGISHKEAEAVADALNVGETDRLFREVALASVPPGEDRRFHGDRAGLRYRPNPAVQFAARGSNLALLVHTASRVLHAIADRLLVYIESYEVHMSLRSLRGCSLNQLGR